MNTVESYIASWNETDPARRRELVGSTWTDDGTYLDPMMSGTGADAIADMIGAAQAQFPGCTFTLATGPDAHTDVVRFTWHLRGPGGGEPLAVGTDFATVAADGRLRAVTGFLDVTP